jgi:DNA-directed RNA polymerase specialized sigma24 family protein
VGDPNFPRLQKELRSSKGLEAWETFLGIYSPILYQTAVAYSDDEDEAADCYLYICEQLSRNGFRRLLKFNPQGSASLTTWLRVVGRNLCYDRHRAHSGRRRPFKLLQFLSELERRVYDCRFERGLSEEETLNQLRPAFADLGPPQLHEVERRVEDSLGSRQRWILSTRQIHFFDLNAALATDSGQEGAAQIADLRSNQEALFAAREQHAQLKKCVAAKPWSHIRPH